MRTDALYAVISALRQAALAVPPPIRYHSPVGHASQCALLALVVVGASACGSVTALGNPDGARACSRSGPGPIDLVIDRLTVDDTDATETGHTGMNLDGLFSTTRDADGCNQQDFYSLYDTDQHRPAGCEAGRVGCGAGVDNQLPTALNSLQAALMRDDLRPAMQAEVVRGRTLILVRIEGASCTDDAANVRVTVLLGFANFADCARAFAGDAEYVVDRRSLRAGGAGAADATFAFDARITAGRVAEIGPYDATFLAPPVVPSALASPIPMERARLRMTLDEGGAHSGVLAGVVRGDLWVAPEPVGVLEFRSAVEAIVAGVVDVRLPGMTTCVDRTGPGRPRFAGVSFGYGFHAVRARILDRVQDAPVPGMCGAR